MNPSDGEIAELHRQVEDALRTGDESGLRVLGYGEISCVLALDGASGDRCAVKRLPAFADRASYSRYGEVFRRYLEALAEHGIAPVASDLRSVERPDGSVIGYCVQPMLEANSLMPDWLRTAGEVRARESFDELSRLIAEAVGPRLGLDGQLSNWVMRRGRLEYLDLTTPLLKNDRGEESLDVGLFVASLPWALRGPVRRFVLPSIIAKYYEPRGVLLDLLGNLQKEGLEALLDPFLEIANRRVSPPIRRAEVAAYYKDDARTWALLLKLRRMDRAWQLNVRRRPYPFLLPRHVDRRV